MVYREWQVTRPDKALIGQLAEATSIGQLVCSVLAARGVDTPQKAHDFLDTEKPLSSPELLLDAAVAADRIRQAVDQGERIVVFGDYDVDGVCATALMYSYLQSIGADVYYKLPSRSDEGYGL